MSNIQNQEFKISKLYPERLNRDFQCSESNDNILSAYDEIMINEIVSRIKFDLNEAKWLDIAKKVVKEKSYVYVHPKTLKISEDEKKGYVVLDMTTANMLVQIADALSDVTREKFTSLPLSKAVDIGWKLVSR